MKTIVLMQPYIFPYFPYFQLFHAADCFVSYDDAQYMKGGWINRNRILLNGEPHFITFPVHRTSLNASIAETSFSEEIDKAKKKVLGTIRQAYSKAPYFDFAYEVLREIIEHDEPNVARFAEHSLKALVDVLGITVEFRRSSELGVDCSLRGQERVISIVQAVRGDVYVNPIGGAALYSNSDFAAKGISLHFLVTASSPYVQFESPFTAGLSIIDRLMFCSVEEIRNCLPQFELTRQPTAAISEDTMNV
jgi:hypothetical protein